MARAVPRSSPTMRMPMAMRPHRSRQGRRRRIDGAPMPRLEFDVATDSIVRHESWLRRRSIMLSDLVEIVGLSRDALTHEEILVAFRTAAGEELVASEFDEAFAATIAGLANRFPGVTQWHALGAGATFESRRCVL